MPPPLSSPVGAEAARAAEQTATQQQFPRPTRSHAHRCSCLTRKQRWVKMSDVCLSSRTSGLSREQRGLGRPKLSQRYPTAHMTRTPLLRSSQRSRSPDRVIHRGLNAWGRCNGDRENVLGVGNYCYVASARRRARLWGAHVWTRGAGHIVSPRAQLVLSLLCVRIHNK